MRPIPSCLVALALLPLAILAGGCSDDGAVVAVAFMGEPIDDLAAMVTTPTTATLTWSAPNAGGTTARGYRIRWRVGSLTDETWDDAVPMDEPPSPSVPDDPDQAWIVGLPAGSTVAFGVKYTQGTGVSPLSNVATVELPPAPDAAEGFAYLPPGSFTMGSPVGEPGHDDDEMLHPVTLTRGFFIAIEEVTRDEYAAVTGQWPAGPEAVGLPVERVSFLDAVAYCNARSLADGLAPVYTIEDDQVAWDRAADGWRLPTEAEWEYACRAGTTTALAGGGVQARGCALDVVLAQFGIYCGNNDANDDPAPNAPASRRHNAWGLYDMHGNVYEWCWDWYEATLEAAVDPVGPDSGHVRVIRGGAWTSGARDCRSASRSYLAPTNANHSIGFRVVRTAG